VPFASHATLKLLAHFFGRRCLVGTTSMTRLEVETNAANKRFKQLFYEHSRRLQGNAILENLKMNGFRRSMKIAPR
jgi:hypothetical protein